MMFIMGIANGVIMAQMNNMNDYFINEPIQIDYLTDPSGEPYTRSQEETLNLVVLKMVSKKKSTLIKSKIPQTLI